LPILSARVGKRLTRTRPVTLPVTVVIEARRPAPGGTHTGGSAAFFSPAPPRPPTMLGMLCRRAIVRALGSNAPICPGGTRGGCRVGGCICGWLERVLLAARLGFRVKRSRRPGGFNAPSSSTVDGEPADARPSCIGLSPRGGPRPMFGGMAEVVSEPPSREWLKLFVECEGAPTLTWRGRALMEDGGRTGGNAPPPG